MVPNDALPVSVSRRGSADPGSDPLRTVIWVRGEHDVATRARLAATITRSARRDDVDIVVDLSGITFMDASTIGALVEAHNCLHARSRALCVRAPSPLARRLFAVCELAFLIEEHPAPAQPPAAAALESWVAVPASDRASNPTRPSVERQACSQEPARDMAPRPGAPAGPVLQPRTPS